MRSLLCLIVVPALFAVALTAPLGAGTGKELSSTHQRSVEYYPGSGAIAAEEEAEEEAVKEEEEEEKIEEESEREMELYAAAAAGRGRL